MELSRPQRHWPPRPDRSNSRQDRFAVAANTLRAWVYALWIVLACCVLISSAISLVTAMHAEAFGLNFLRMGSLDAFDSWGPMRLAIEHLRAAPEIPIYQDIFFAQKVKFQYPVSSLLAIDLFQRASGLHWETVISLLNRVCWYAVWAIGFVTWRLLVRSYERTAYGPAASSSQELPLLWPCLGLTILFYPLSKSYALGQIQTILTLLGALALLCWQSNRKILAAVCIGLCCAVKPQWAVILIWAGLRREWTFLLAAGAACGAIVIASAAHYGIHHYIDYLSALSFMSRHGEAYYPNQSVNGLLNRLLFNGNNLTFDMHDFPPFNAVVYGATIVSTVLILGAALLYRRDKQPNVLDLALIMLAATMASPIAWEHHYGILLPIFAVLAPYVSRKPLVVGVLVVAFLVSSQRLEPINRLADSALNVLQSYLFFAGLAVLTLLVLASRRGDAAPSR